MVRHPSHSFSLDSKTLFDSEEDKEKYDLRRDKLWKDSRFLKYVKSISECIWVSKRKLNELARNLNPVELQVQTLLEILYNQKLHCTNPLEYEKSTATKHYYIKALGLELSLKLDQLIDDSNTSFEYRKIPQHWLSILPARAIETNHKLHVNFKNLVSSSFKLLNSYWQKSGLLSERGEVIPELEPKQHTIAKNTLGKNIGIKTTPYLLLGGGCNVLRKLKNKLFGDENPFTVHRESCDVTYVPNNIPSINFLYKVKNTLNKYGVAVVRNVFSKEQIAEIRKKMYLKSTMARDNAFKIIEVDPNVSTLKFTRGRINCILRGTTFNECLSPLQSFWIPFVYYFLKNDKKIFMSNLQLVSSDSMSYVEPWHRENKHSGISVVVPLQDIDKNNGRLQFLPGTHKDLIKVSTYRTGPVGIDLREGDLLIYNSSILHRNTINDSDVCQSMLVFSYDHVDTPPPGQGLVKYMVDNYYGNAIVNINRDEVKHIGSHKFRFNDEILDLYPNVVNLKPRPNEELRRKVVLNYPRDFFKRISLLKLKKNDTHTQSIGYTSDNYPNPVTNPQLCVHTFYAKTFLCDPDGILSELEQEKLNQKLANCVNKTFATLSHNIFVDTGKDKEQAQLQFAAELLKAYSRDSHADEKSSILLNYVKEFQSLKIIVGEELLGKKLKEEYISKLEKEFNESKKGTYESLIKVIEGLNSNLKTVNRGIIFFSCLIVALLLSIWGWHMFDQSKSKSNG